MRAKLAVAAAAAELDPSYQRNIEALKAVQPADLQPGDIEARLGSSWIPATDIRDFVAELLDIPPRTVRVAPRRRHRHLDRRDSTTAPRSNVSNTTTYGTRALSRLRPHRARAQRPHADRL